MEDAGVNTDDLSHSSEQLAGKIDTLKKKQGEAADKAMTFGDKAGQAFNQVHEAIVAAGIPVMGHVGMTPQSVMQFGGFKVQGRGDEAAERVFQDALAVQEAGAFAVVLECVPAALAAEITQTLHIPTIGIGAGVNCDGQVLVTQDMLGQYCDYGPKFVRRFAQVGDTMRAAFNAYDEAVKGGEFPSEKETFS